MNEENPLDTGSRWYTLDIDLFTIDSEASVRLCRKAYVLAQKGSVSSVCSQKLSSRLRCCKQPACHAVLKEAKFMIVTWPHTGKQTCDWLWA